jgi:hypothetical protein
LKSEILKNARECIKDGNVNLGKLLQSLVFYDLFYLHRIYIIECETTIMSGDLVRILKQAVTNYFMVFSQRLPV